jgi:hypothetical protein
MRRPPRTALRLNRLEDRDAPATLASATTVTYRDADGDAVTVVLSKPLLTAANVGLALAFDSGGVTGNNGSGQQLRTLDLTKLGPGAAGVSVAVTATRSAAGGDGFAAVGQVLADGLDLGTVAIDGDLGSVQAGDGDTTTPGLAGLAVHSLGRYGTATGAATLGTSVEGAIGFVRVRGDVQGAAIFANHGGIGTVNIGGSLIGETGLNNLTGAIEAGGDLGPVVIGRDVVGAGAGNQPGLGRFTGEVFCQGRLAAVTVGGSVIGGPGDSGGRIVSRGDMGPVTIRGSLVGGSGSESGQVSAQGKLARVTVGRSVRGGAGQDSGEITSGGDVGTVAVGGDLVGGRGQNSGRVFVTGGVLRSRLSIAGSIVGGAGNESGEVNANAQIGGSPASASVAVRGDIVGGAGLDAGSVKLFNPLARVTVSGSIRGGTGPSSGLIQLVQVGTVAVGGDLLAGTGQGGAAVLAGQADTIAIGGSVVGALSESGRVDVSGPCGTLSIGGNLIGGSATGTASLTDSGFVRAVRIGRLTIGGSVVAGTDTTTGTFRNNGAVRVADDIGSVLVRGSLVGNPSNPAVIAARGQAAPAPGTDLAIGRMTVLGRVERALVLAGANSDGVVVNMDAQVGPVVVGGDWIASSLAAGVVAGPDRFFGDADDFQVIGTGIKNDPAVVSTIASWTVGGQVLGTLASSDFFGIVAQAVGAVKVNGVSIPTTAGTGNDDFFVGVTADFKVNEL